jgi:hypothetical protein
MPEKKRDLIIATVLLAFCGFWTIQAGKIRDVTIPGTPGPRYFPNIIIAALAVMAVALAIPALLSLAKGGKKAKLQAPAPSEAAGCVEPEGVKPQRLKVVGVFVAIFGYIMAVEQIGFFVATALASVFMLLVFMNIRNWKMLILSSAVITGSLFVIFRLIIKISLPSGILF